MIYNQRHFTIIEMLFAIAIIAILTAMLMPSFNESRARARFVRWLHFNKQCNTDPTCVINLNFQEGEGGTLKNAAKGHEAENFDAHDYNGIVKGDYEWTSGRWRKGKKAIQFDGASTYIEFANTKNVNFDGSSNFTVIIWMKFDRLDKWDGIFGKCYMRNPVNGYPQYAVYYDGTKGNNKTPSGEFAADIGEHCVDFENFSESGNKIVKLNTSEWFQLTMRNKVVNDEQQLDLFYNGIKLKSEHIITKGFKKHKDEARLAIGCIRWLLIKNKVPESNGKPSNFFKGKIDEFLIYNRALTNNEITAHYVMGDVNYN
jgi:Concanavalin A-like lectin/glucanases superfamily/Prokaryotic N-terminal methylation motif